MPDAQTHSRLRRLPPAIRRALGLVLAAAAIAYCILLGAAFLQVTPSSSLFPRVEEIDRLIFDGAHPVSRAERLLENTGDTVEGGGTMRPAFTVQSVGWEAAVENLSEEEQNRLLREREGERVAVLDWIRSGASREAYDNDDHPLHAAVGANTITAAYRWPERAAEGAPVAARVRIRSLIADRCVTCHSEEGRHDTARFIPLDSYDRLAPRLQPEPADPRRRWVVAVLGGLFPLALVCAAGYWFTSHPLPTRALIMTLTLAALVVMVACGLLGRMMTWHGALLFASAAIAAGGTAFQSLATLGELFSREAH